ncbi:MAG: histidine phosphatase family protein [Rubellimicrobium sp.]|nr:histidine phosphatase family protein [Rubellimicrobium sp.]
MKRLWLVRHGPTHARTLTGWTDLPADLGDGAALARLAAALPEVPVVSSDLLRAVATADAITGARPRLPHDPGLREMNFGRWEGLSAAEVAARDPDLSRTFWSDPAAAAPPDGEGWQALVARVHAATGRLLARHDELIVVAHFGPILALAQRATGESAAEVMGRTVAPLSLGEITIAGPDWSLRRLNVLL